MMEGFLPEKQSDHPVEIFAFAAVQRTCWRCKEGHAVWREWRANDAVFMPEWSHGTETLDSGVGIPPEPCDAAAIHETLYEWRQEQNR